MNNRATPVMWMDFVMDDFIGPTLVIPEMRNFISCREEQTSQLGVMEDARDGIVAIQETGQEQRSARMVDQSASISAAKNDSYRMEAIGVRLDELFRRRGKG